VNTPSFPINIINFDDKKFLVWSSAADMGKGKDIIIGDTREADENAKISCKKVVTKDPRWRRDIKDLHHNLQC
jgi:hypothetical protein